MRHSACAWSAPRIKASRFSCATCRRGRCCRTVSGAVHRHGRCRLPTSRHLHLALDDATPDAFDLRIDVVASSGVAAGSSVARVRLVAAPPPGETAVLAFEGTPPEAAPPMAEAAPDLQQQKAPVATPSRNRVRDDKGKTATVPSAPVAGQRHWPEGASGLGAVSQSSRAPGLVEAAAAILVAVPQRHHQPALTSASIANRRALVGWCGCALAWRSGIYSIARKHSCGAEVATARRPRHRSET